MTNLAGIVISVLMGFIYLFWRSSTQYSLWWGSPGRKTGISWLLLYSWIASKSIVIVRREDPAALFEQGLSVQNLIQIAIIAIALIWCIYLLLSRELTFKSFICGPRLWISLTVGVFALSTFWSIMPSLTSFRVSELAVVWGLIIHVITGSTNPIAAIRKYLLVTIALVLFGTFYEVYLDNVTEHDTIFALFRSNIGGAVAGIAFLFFIARLGYYSRKKNITAMIFSLIALFLFGSLATLIAVLITLPIMQLSIFKNKTIKVSTLFIILIILLIIFWGIERVGAGPMLLHRLADVLHKTPESILNLSGRLPLWHSFWEITQDSPWGKGFAVDRLASVFLIDRSTVGWQASNAHSGYWSAWLGAGWMGLILVFLSTLSVWHYSHFYNLRLQIWVRAAIILIIINNLTITGVGGAMNPLWGSMMALTLLKGEFYEVVSAT